MPNDIQTLETLQTPCLLLDQARLRTNVSRMKTRLAGLGAAFRPHLKTAKSLDVACIAMTSPEGPAMVSTLREAADRDYQLTVLSDACLDADPEVQRVLMEKVFSRQAQVLTVTEWQATLH